MNVIDQLSALLPYAIPALLGVLVSYLTALLTKSHLSSGWKVVVNAVLGLLAGAVATVAYQTTGDWKRDLEAYAVAVLIAWASSAVTYLAGGSQVLERATWNFGIGRKATADAQMGEYADDDQSGQLA